MENSALYNYRKLKKINQTQLGLRFGVRKAAISKWENGKVPHERVLDVSDITGIPAHILRPDLYRAPERPPRDINEDISGQSEVIADA